MSRPLVERNEEQRFLQPIERQQMQSHAGETDGFLRADRMSPFDVEAAASGFGCNGLPADDESRMLKAKGHEAEALAIASVDVDDMGIVFIVRGGVPRRCIAPAQFGDEAGGWDSLAERIAGIGPHETVGVRVELRDVPGGRRNHAEAEAIAGDEIRGSSRSACQQANDDVGRKTPDQGNDIHLQQKSGNKPANGCVASQPEGWADLAQ